jgi:alpha-1,3-mannosyl-glycoprotein beta-1,2-N-acetylglucosaminyltransferase
MFYFIFSGLFYEKHLKFIKLNEEFVPFTQKNLTYLLKVSFVSYYYYNYYYYT